MIATIVLFVLFLLIICLVFATNVILKQALVCAYLTRIEKEIPHPL